MKHQRHPLSFLNEPFNIREHKHLVDPLFLKAHKSIELPGIVKEDLIVTLAGGTYSWNPQVTDVVNAKLVISEGQEVTLNTQFKDAEFHVEVILHPHSQLKWIQQSDGDSLSMHVMSEVAHHASLDIRQAWQGKRSYFNFQTHLSSFSSASYKQRIVALAGVHTSCAELIIPPQMKEANIIQETKVLRLSPAAQVHLKPWLWIGHDQVSAKHGTAIGSLSEESLHYLKTRGFNEAASTSILTRSFLHEHL